MLDPNVQQRFDIPTDSPSRLNERKKTVKISSKKKKLKENFLIKVPIKKSDFNKYSGARMDILLSSHAILFGVK